VNRGLISLSVRDVRRKRRVKRGLPLACRLASALIRNGWYCVVEVDCGGKMTLNVSSKPIITEEDAEEW
jgi:hypothetical protein